MLSPLKPTSLNQAASRTKYKSPFDQDKKFAKFGLLSAAKDYSDEKTQLSTLDYFSQHNNEDPDQIGSAADT